MANYEILKIAIQNAVDWDNNDKQISGNDMLAILSSIINNTVSAGYLFAGVATPSTNPGTPDQNVFYLCGPGVYPNFGGIAIGPWQFGVFKYNGSWQQETIDASGLVTVTEDGWFIVDEALNVVMKYDADGLDVAKVSDHFKSLLGGGAVLVQVVEDGLYFVDEQMNIGAKLTTDGLFAKNLMSYEII